MKRIFPISFIAIATLLSLVLTVIPHHHHKEVTCLVMERCEKDNAVNDELTGHQPDSGDMNHGKSCIADADYVAPQSSQETKCKSSCDDPNHEHFFPLYYLCADFLIYNLVDTSPKPEYGEYIVYYKPEEASQYHGLRAPPYFLS